MNSRSMPFRELRRRGFTLAAALLVLLGAAPRESAAKLGAAPACSGPEDCSLWEAGRIAGVRIGFHDENGTGGPEAEIAAAEGNAFTNHGMSWAAFQPTPNGVTGSLDAACAFAEEHGLFQVGFHFVWDQLLLDDLAGWVLAIDDADELRGRLRERVKLIFERCPGLDRIDVVNEPLATLNGSTLYPNHFFQVLGPNYISELFQIARDEAPPGVELFLNEIFLEYFPARAAAFVALVRGLVEAGAPVDAVGLQGHLLLGEPSWALFRKTLEELAALGVKVFVSELDVPVSPSLPDRFQVQAERYRKVVETCLAVPACDTIIVWGIDDAHTWLDWFDLLSGPDPDPLLFDAFLQPKPAYFAVHAALRRGRGGDHPIAGRRLAVTTPPRGRSILSLTSDDPGIVTPSPGSLNDPRRGDPGGATIELLRLDGSLLRTVVVPDSGRWSVANGVVKFRDDFRRSDSVISLKLREGRGLQLVLASDGVTASDAADGLRIRLTLGSLRTCVEFGPETVVASSQRSFVAADAPKAAGYDCSYGP